MFVRVVFIANCRHLFVGRAEFTRLTQIIQTIQNYKHTCRVLYIQLIWSRMANWKKKMFFSLVSGKCCAFTMLNLFIFLHQIHVNFYSNLYYNHMSFIHWKAELVSSEFSQIRTETVRAKWTQTKYKSSNEMTTQKAFTLHLIWNERMKESNETSKEIMFYAHKKVTPRTHSH